MELFSILFCVVAGIALGMLSGRSRKAQIKKLKDDLIEAKTTIDIKVIESLKITEILAYKTRMLNDARADNTACKKAIEKLEQELKIKSSTVVNEAYLTKRQVRSILYFIDPNKHSGKTTQLFSEMVVTLPKLIRLQK